MNPSTATVNADVLRAQLMARDPMQRVMALHAIEVQAEHGEGRLAGQVEAFTARGIPFYAPDTAHYQAWVGRALSFWERAHAPATAE